MMIPAVAKSSRAEREGQSPFFRDLATPVSARRSAAAGRFSTPAQAAAVSALWRDNLASVDPPPPPPPAFTLGDRFDISPEPAFAPSPTPPSPETRTPPHSFYAPASSPSPLKVGVDPSASGTAHDGGLRILRQPSFGESGLLSPGKSVGSGDRLGKGKGSPVDGIIQSGALITLPPPREVAMPEVRRNTSMPVAGGLDEEQWVTVYGFSLGDTNLVLREFEKCGVILKHILGPRDANWVHILYQSQYDARKALAKDGLQLNNVIIIGVKTVDPQQKQYLNQHFENNLNRGLIVPLPSESGGMNSSATSLIAPTHQNYFKQNIINSGSSETGQRAIATPTKSVLSKVMDLMFSI